MKRITLSHVGEGAILFLVAFSVLWKGGKTLEMTWLFALLSGLLAVATLARRVFRVRRTEDEAGDPHMAVWGLIIFYAVWTVASYLLSETKNYGLDDVLRDVSAVILFLWIVRDLAAKGDSSFLPNFLKVITSVTVAACLIGLAVYTLEPVDRFVGSFFDYRFDTDFWPNAWGEYLLLSWPMVLLHAIRTDGKKKRWLFSAILGLMLGSLFLSYSRGSVLALGAQAGLVTLLLLALALRDVRYQKKILTNVRSAALHCAVVFGIAIILFFAANSVRSVRFPVQSVTEKVTFTASEGRSSIDERAQFWGQALKAASEKPLFGYGPYSFRFVQTKDAQGVLATSDHPHNVFLKLAMERGWPSAISYALIMCSVCLYALHKLFFKRRADWSRENDARDLLLGIAVIGVLAHNLIDYNLQFIALKLPMWIVIAILYAPAAAGRTNRTSSFWQWKVSRIAIKIEFLLAFALLVVACVEGYYLVTSSYARHAEAAGNAEEALLWYDRSEGEQFGRDMLLSKSVLLMDAGKTQEAADALNEYAALNPHDARVWKLKGILALKMRDAKSAFENVAQAFRLGKMTDLGITTLYLQTAISAGKQDVIQSQKTDIDTLFSLYANAIGQNTHFIALSRNVEELQTVAGLLGQMFPDDAGEYRTIARQAADHAETERARLTSRKPGILW